MKLESEGMPVVPGPLLGLMTTCHCAAGLASMVLKTSLQAAPLWPG